MQLDWYELITCHCKSWGTLEIWAWCDLDTLISMGLGPGDLCRVKLLWRFPFVEKLLLGAVEIYWSWQSVSNLYTVIYFWITYLDSNQSKLALMVIVTCVLCIILGPSTILWRPKICRKMLKYFVRNPWRNPYWRIVMTRVRRVRCQRWQLWRAVTLERLPLTSHPTPPTDVSPPLFEKWTRPQSPPVFVLFLDTESFWPRIFTSIKSLWHGLSSPNVKDFWKWTRPSITFHISAFDSQDLKETIRRRNWKQYCHKKV